MKPEIDQWTRQSGSTSVFTSQIRTVSVSERWRRSVLGRVEFAKSADILAAGWGVHPTRSTTFWLLAFSSVSRPMPMITANRRLTSRKSSVVHNTWRKHFWCLCTVLAT